MIKVKILLYCTKNGRPLIYTDEYRGGAYWEGYTQTYNRSKEEVSKIWGEEAILNGRIVAECECDLVEVIKYASYDCTYYTNTIDTFGLPPLLLQKSCLDHDALDEYLKEDNGHAIYLKNVKVFDEPKELSDYGLKRAPQNMMWVWYKGERYVLISIKPKWLCKILNGEKTIEVRRKILKGLKDLIK